MARAMGNMELSSQQGTISPQLPSPNSAGASSGTRGTGSDQNPPVCWPLFFIFECPYTCHDVVVLVVVIVTLKKNTWLIMFFFRIQINTLYVGNLPTSPAPSGYAPNHLEDSLRALFQRCQGFRRLCFRQKANGPMCFVEVCDPIFLIVEDKWIKNLNCNLVWGCPLRHEGIERFVRTSTWRSREGRHPTLVQQD